MKPDNSKRDLNLIRQIMLDMEAGKSGDYSGHDRALVLFNKWLLIDSEMAIGSKATSNDYLTAVILIRLTWKGCEFLDLARDQNRWESVMKQVAKTVGSVTFPVLSNLLTQSLSTALGLK